MNRRDTVLGLLALGAAPLFARAQQAGKIPVIGMLVQSPTVPSIRIIKQALRDAGYVEGKTIVIEARFWEGLDERLPDLAYQERPPGSAGVAVAV